MPEQPALEPRQIYPYADELVRYEPKTHIGSGGSGAEVCYGFWYHREPSGVMPGREAALKYRYFSEEDMLQAASGGTNQTLARFICEVSCVQDAGPHPNTMKIWDYEVDTEGGRIIMAMPYYGGGRLNRRMGAPMPVDEALDYAAQIGGALQHLHKHGIVHRDVKPSNLLFANDGRLILTDFDIAGRVHAQGYREENGSKIVDGTPDYIAPEQVRGEPIQPQSDQYALAALVYQMVTGGTVFRGTQQDVLNAHLSLMPESFEARMKGCVSPLAQAIEPCLVKALAKHPSQRYDSVADFIQAMQEAVAEQSQRARYAEPILQYGLLAAMRGNAVEAHEYFTYAIETDPTNITACYMDAIALGQLGATNDAQARYAEVQELVPRSPDEMVMKGHAATATGHTVKAIGYYRKALELGGGNVSELESRIADLQNQIRAAVGETTVRGVTGRLRSFLRGFGRRTDTRRADPGLVYG